MPLRRRKVIEPVTPPSVFDRNVANPKTRGTRPGSGPQPTHSYREPSATDSTPGLFCLYGSGRLLLLLFRIEQHPLRIPRRDVSDAPARLAGRALADVLFREVRRRQPHTALGRQVRGVRVGREPVEAVGQSGAVLTQIHSVLLLHAAG